MDTALRNQILARTRLALMLMGTMALCVASSVVWIYVDDAEALREAGIKQLETLELLPAHRGAILDRNGRPLVINVPRYDLAIDPTAAGFKASKNDALRRIAHATGISVEALTKRIAARTSNRYASMFTLTEEQWATLSEEQIPGVILTEHPARRYIHNETAAHVLGHVDADGAGIAGLELQYEHLLAGKTGRRRLLRDRLGQRRADPGATIQEPADGHTIVLTIDMVRQTILEEELRRGVTKVNAARGTAIAMDPRTGAILALANWPTFDPNHPGRYPAAHWRNYAVTDRMEPGSTFKLVTAIAALELGIMAIDRPVNAGDGVAVFHGNTMRDTRAHGSIPFSDVIAFSSNIGMAQTGAQLQPADLYRYARNLGFGVKTLIDLPGEVSGLLKRPKHWSVTTPTSMSIGYDVEVTAIQMLAAYASLANRGLLVQPYIVSEHRSPLGYATWRKNRDTARRDSVRRAFDESTADALRPAFEAAVRKGTARLARIPGTTVAGKTGTARKVVNGVYGPKYRASFVGYFTADDPEVVMIVVLDEPETGTSGGDVAAPVFQAIGERWRKLDPPPASRLRGIDSLIVPDVRGLPLAAAQRLLTRSGFTATDTPDSAAPVITQQPAPEAWSAANAPVYLRTGFVDHSPKDWSRLDARGKLFALTAAANDDAPTIDSTAVADGRPIVALIGQ